MTTKLYSIGDIAALLAVRIHVAQYQIERQRIDPVMDAGGRHLYDDAAVEKIREAICKRTAAK